jgi:hypothetical protein
MDKPIGKLKLLTTEGEVLDAILYCHQETTSIGATYYLLKLNTSADASGTTLSASTASVARVVWEKFVYSLSGIQKILSATIYATYRAYTGGGTVNAEIDIKILQSNNTVRTTIATGVSKSSNLGSSWTTYTGANYSFAEYTVVSDTDYLEIDYIANVTAKKSGQYAYLRIDDNTLGTSDQTRSQEWSLAGVATLDATSVSITTATLNGQITGTETMTVRGFEWGKQSGNYTDSWTETGTFPPDTFSHSLTNLDSNTTYYFRAKAYNSTIGWTYGSELSFTTSLGVTVGTSPTAYATTNSFQRKSFYANGRFWAFYSDGSNMVYKTSTDGSTWSAPTIVRAVAAGLYFSVWFDGTYLHYAYAPSSSIYYRRGTPNSDGSITWSADEQTVSTTYNNANLPMVSVDSNGYVWIGYTDYDGTYYYPYVIKSGNNDGTWGTTPSPFPYQLSTTSGGWRVSVIPLTSGKMLAVYAYTSATVKAKRWTGSAWDTEVATTSAAYVGAYHSVVAQGDDAHLVFMKQTTYDILYVKYTYSSNSFGTETTLQAGATSDSAPVLSIDTATNDLYVFATTKTTGTPSGWTANHIYYKKYTASSSSWGLWINWINEESEVLTSSSYLTCFYNAYSNYIGLLYMTKPASPYNVKFAYMSLAAVIETIVAKNFPMDYLPSPAKAEQLTSKVSGATIQLVNKDLPLTLIKKGKANELKSKFQA